MPDEPYRGSSPERLGQILAVTSAMATWRYQSARYRIRRASGFRTNDKLCGEYGQDAAGRYSPSQMIETIVKIWDDPPTHDTKAPASLNAKTSRFVGIRRFTRLTNAFSKKLDNHKAACALHFACYNFCRIHKTLRVTPAMEAGLTDHIWTVRELLA
jgi:hypothetical protein